MDLFVVRHAIAAPYSPDLPDGERPLTAEGRARFRTCVRGLRSLKIGFDHVLHSPLLRAVQTAEELDPILEGARSVSPLLAEPPGEELLGAVAATGGERVALVGHEPWMSSLVASLTGDGRGAVEMRKGSVAHLAGRPRPGGMVLRALLPPRVLVRLG